MFMFTSVAKMSRIKGWNFVDPASEPPHMRALGNAMFTVLSNSAKMIEKINIAFPSALIWGGSEAGSTRSAELSPFYFSWCSVSGRATAVFHYWKLVWPEPKIGAPKNRFLQSRSPLGNTLHLHACARNMSKRSSGAVDYFGRVRWGLRCFYTLGRDRALPPPGSARRSRRFAKKTPLICERRHKDAKNC